KPASLVGLPHDRQYRFSRLSHTRSGAVLCPTQKSTSNRRKRERTDRRETFEPPVAARTCACGQALGLQRYQKLFSRAVEPRHALQVQSEVSRSRERQTRTSQRCRLRTCSVI